MLERNRPGDERYSRRGQDFSDRGSRFGEHEDDRSFGAEYDQRYRLRSFNQEREPGYEQDYGRGEWNRRDFSRSFSDFDRDDRRMRSPSSDYMGSFRDEGSQRMGRSDRGEARFAQDRGDNGHWGEPNRGSMSGRGQDWGHMRGYPDNDFRSQNASSRMENSSGIRNQAGSLYSQGSDSRIQHFGKGPKGYQRSDDRIREELNDEFFRHTDVDASDIEIQVRSGEVTLSGTVSSRQEKRLAEDLSESILGVKEVHNQLRVKSQQGPYHQESLASSMPMSSSPSPEQLKQGSSESGEGDKGKDRPEAMGGRSAL